MRSGMQLGALLNEAGSGGVPWWVVEVMRRCPVVGRDLSDSLAVLLCPLGFTSHLGKSRGLNTGNRARDENVPQGRGGRGLYRLRHRSLGCVHSPFSWRPFLSLEKVLFFSFR